MGNQNYIVINGKKYDAITGKMLPNASQTAPKHIQTVQPNIPPNQVVDGFVRTKSRPAVTRTPAKHANKVPQKSQTLNRKAVHKPTQPHVQTPVEKPGVLKKTLGISPRRQFIANETQKSPHIHKYGAETARSSVVKKHVTKPVRPAPISHSGTQPQPIHNPTKQHTSTNTHKDNMFDSALASANSHNETAPIHTKHSKRRNFTKKLGVSGKAIAMSSAIFALAILGGFFALQNVPNLSMRVAATRAGLDASMPGYTPSGFSFRGPIQYEPGKVTITFGSNADERSYVFAQTASNWNSDALLANFIEPEKKQYQTYQDRGRTLYIYDGSNATWIDDGIWYQVEGDSKMTTDQLIRIAASI